MVQSKEELEVIQYLKDNFYYKNEALYWAAHRKWGNTKAGTKNDRGYLVFSLNISNKKRQYSAHRVIFAMHHGYLPELVDHIDRNPENNSINNLRDATFTLNARNKSVHSNNILGIRGICKIGDSFKARIMVDRKAINLGTFNTIEDATTARKQAEATYWPNL